MKFVKDSENCMTFKNYQIVLNIWGTPLPSAVYTGNTMTLQSVLLFIFLNKKFSQTNCNVGDPPNAFKNMHPRICTILYFKETPIVVIANLIFDI